MNITIYGNTPSKKNSKIMVCRGKFPILLPSANYTKWHEDALRQLSIYKNKIENTELTLTFYADNNRKFDLTNRAESIMDTLVDAGFIEDDNYTIISKLHLVFGGVDKGNARCEIDYESRF